MIRRIATSAALLAFTTALAAQSPARPTTPPGADSTQLDVLRDILAAPGWSSWNVGERRLCLDPDVAHYPRPGAAPPTERWTTGMLTGLLELPFVAIDSTVGAVPPGGAACARSTTTARLAYGIPIVTGNVGTIDFVVTRLDRHAEVDSTMRRFRLARRGSWIVDGWAADSQTTHIYIRGEGCYRFSHPPFVYGIRIDTAIVRAFPDSVARPGHSSPLHLLAIGKPRPIIQTPLGERSSYWHASHDSLFLAWNDVNSFLSVALRVLGDSLEGRMTWETDAVVPDPPSVHVTGTRVACPQQ